jgi:hypothetical protein
MDALYASKTYEIFEKGRPLGMSQLKRLNLKVQIQNEI